MARPTTQRPARRTASTRLVHGDNDSSSEDEGTGKRGQGSASQRRRTSQASRKTRAFSYDSFDSGSEVDMDETADFIGPGGKQKRATRPKAPKAEKARANATRIALKGKANGTQAGLPSAPVRKGVRSTVRGAASREDLDIHSDVPLFNAIRNPESALQTAVEDWVVAYQSEPTAALTELVNCILRCCGCNSTVDEATTMDLDNVVDALEELQEELRKAPLPSYPIISRAADFKKFKKSLAEFVQRLIATAAESELLLTAPTTSTSSDDVIDQPLISVLKEWLSAQTSSTFRSLRHTATFMVLTAVDSLATLLADKRRSVEVARKQRDLARKRATTQAGKKRLDTMEQQWQTEKEDEAQLLDCIRDLVDGVFQHRYRDADALIRTDCATELGRWMKAHPDMFMRNQYYRYLGWCLSDLDAAVRSAALRALATLYARTAFPDSLRHFSNLSKARLVQIATQDIDLTVRLTAIDVLNHIDRRGLLESQESLEIGKHIFDTEPRIRNEIAHFVTRLIDEEVESQEEAAFGSAPASETNRDAKTQGTLAKRENDLRKLRFKVLSRKLIAYEAALETKRDQMQNDFQISLEAAPRALVANNSPRMALAIEPLLALAPNEIPATSCETLLELLLYDHSAEQESSRSASRNGSRNYNAAARGPASYVGAPPSNDAYRLEPDEETVLLQALVVVVTQSRSSTDTSRRVNGSKSLNPAENDADNAVTHAQESVDKDHLADVTRILVPALSKLFAKYRTEDGRVLHVLRLVPFLHLDLYGSTGQTSTFSSLWEEVSGHFLRSTDSALLQRGASCIRSLVLSANAHAAMADLTSTKLSLLLESIIGALREPLKGKEIAMSELDSDSVFELQANLERLAEIAAATDCSEVIDDAEHGQVSSGWEIIREIALRAKLGHQGEVEIIATCLRILTTHLLWRARSFFMEKTIRSSDETRSIAHDLLDKRTELLELLEELLAASEGTVVREAQTIAATRLLQVYLAFHSIRYLEGAPNAVQSPTDAPHSQHKENLPQDSAEASTGRIPPAGVVAKLTEVSISETTQRDCLNVILSEIDRHLMAKSGEDRDTAADDGVDDDSGDEQPDSRRAGTHDARVRTNSRSVAQSSQRSEQEMKLVQLVTPLVNAIRLGLVHIELTGGLIARLGRVSHLLDASIKLIIEVLREDGIVGGEGRKTVEVILDSLKDSFEVFLQQGSAEAEAHFLHLARSISSALVIRGAQLAVLQAIDPAALLTLHRKGSQWALEQHKNAKADNGEAIRTRVPAFWKGLSQLLVSAKPRDANEIKMACQQAVDSSGVDTSSDSKAWEPLRQYQKRLVTLMAKRTTASVPAGATPKKAKAGPQGGATETGVDDTASPTDGHGHDASGAEVEGDDDDLSEPPELEDHDEEHAGEEDAPVSLTRRGEREESLPAIAKRRRLAR